MADGSEIPVVAAVIEREGRYLLGRRPEDKRHAGLWEFPGGKMLDGESFFEAARRELEEELGLTATGDGALLHSARDPGSPFVINFVEISVDGTPQPVEHSDIGWFTAAELVHMPLAPSDRAFAAWLADRN